MKFRANQSALILVVMVLCTGLWAGYLYARSGGVSGVCDQPDGCSCHDDLPNANGTVTVTITGPQMVSQGATNTYTLTVSGGPSGDTGGFNLCADGGTLIPGTGSELGSGELRQSNGNNRSWSFDWTAPATPGTRSFVAVAQATNGSGSSGDSWNWYGDAQGTPFQIEVLGPVPVLPRTWGSLKALYR